MKKLIEQVKAGEKGAEDVLHDHLLEQGVEHSTAVDFINALSLGPMPDQNWSHQYQAIMRSEPNAPPFITELRVGQYYDTVVLQGAQGAQFQFFRDLQDKPDADTNLQVPRRLRYGDRLQVRRVSIIMVRPMAWLRDPIKASVRVQVNRREPMVLMPLDALLARGFWGQQVLQDVADRDDLHGRIELNEPLLEPVTVRLALHGWLQMELR